MTKKEIKTTTIQFVSLGCFKNLVDTEVLGGLLEERGLRIVDAYEAADWLVINTCGFVRDAKAESIDEILAALEKKEAGEIKHVAVFGCLTQRYLQDLRENFPTLDLLWGVNDLEELADAIARGEPVPYADRAPFLYSDRHRRIVTTVPNTAFIKISEGCNMPCSFCTIPKIRGAYRSRPVDSIVTEARRYRESGVQELVLISQNSTHYGWERAGRSELPELLAAVAGLGFPWVRVLYLMPEEVDERIIEGFAPPGILPYFDLPFQHAAANVLKKMARGGSPEANRQLTERIRARFPDAVLRSTFIVGFPGEGRTEYEELRHFVADARIERVGAFVFSPEENTPAFDLAGSVSPRTAKSRFDRLLDLSDHNLEAFNRSLVGTEQAFLPQGPWNDGSTIGRIASQAPEVDGFTEVAGVPFDDRREIYRIRIVRSENEMLYGEKI